MWGQEVHCCTCIEDAIDCGVGVVNGVGATIISAVKIINNGGVINQITVIQCMRTPLASAADHSAVYF